MPWKERSVVEERMRFVLRLKDGESMASLCREFGISRVTGYKVYERCQLGELANSGIGCYADCPTMSAYPLAALFTPSWTAMAWLRGKGALALKPKVPLYPKDLLPMLCGAP